MGDHGFCYLPFRLHPIRRHIALTRRRLGAELLVGGMSAAKRQPRGRSGRQSHVPGFARVIAGARLVRATSGSCGAQHAADIHTSFEGGGLCGYREDVCGASHSAKPTAKRIGPSHWLRALSMPMHTWWVRLPLFYVRVRSSGPAGDLASYEHVMFYGG